MIRSLAVLAAAVSVLSPAAMACGDGNAQDAALVRQIEAKFGLKANSVTYRCGGGAVEFRYRPPENLVPPNSYFARWNQEFSLGAISSEADLQAMLAMTPEQMSALIMANVHFIQDGYETENRYGVRAYHPNALPSAERLDERGMLMYVVAPHCRVRGWSTNADPLGEARFPVHSLEGVSLIGRVPLYQKGDTMRIIQADDAVMAKLEDAARDNIVAERYMTGRTLCSEGMERGAVIRWEDVLRLRADSGAGR